MNIQDKITGTDFYLLAFAKQIIPNEIKQVAKKYSNLVSIGIIPFTPETSALFERFGIRKFGFYLVRPDMHIACRSTETEDLENYFQKLSCWIEKRCGKL